MWSHHWGSYLCIWYPASHRPAYIPQSHFPGMSQNSLPSVKADPSCWGELCSTPCRLPAGPANRPPLQGWRAQNCSPQLHLWLMYSSHLSLLRTQQRRVFYWNIFWCCFLQVSCLPRLLDQGPFFTFLFRLKRNVKLCWINLNQIKSNESEPHNTDRDREHVARLLAHRNKMTTTE